MDTNREIKFRIWDKDNKAFAYIDRLQFLRGDPSKILSKDSHLEGQLHGGTQAYYKVGKKTEVILNPRVVQNCVIQQFTGLKDKNGKDIYEGDIIDEDRFDDLNGPKRGYVKWSYSGYEMFPWPVFKQYFIYPGHKRHLEILERPYMDFGNRALMIIGNIFENPEIPCLESDSRHSKSWGFENYYREFPDMIPKEITKEQHEENVRKERLSSIT